MTISKKKQTNCIVTVQWSSEWGKKILINKLACNSLKCSCIKSYCVAFWNINYELQCWLVSFKQTKNATCKKSKNELTKQYSIRSKLIKVTSYFNINFISNNHLSEQYNI